MYRMRRADRLFQIVQHLRARRLTTAARLAELLEVSERTIYRDIRDLSLSGVPIQGEAGVGYRIDKSYELTPLMFSKEEVEAIVVGLRMVEAFGDSTLDRATKPALDKIILALPGMRQLEPEQSRIFAPRLPKKQIDKERLKELNKAIKGREKIRITYQSLGGEESRRVVWPLALYFWGTAWTLAAWCELRQEFRTFRTDMLKGLEVTGEHFNEETGKTLANYLKKVGAE